MKKPFGLFAAGCLAGIIALTALLASGCDIFSGNSDNSLNPGGGSNPGTDSNPTLPSNPNPNPTPPSTPPPQKPNSGEEITALSIGGIQGTRTTGNRTVTVTLPAGTTVTELKNLAPVITYSGTGISPASGVSQNFYKNGFTPVLYTVTAANGSTAVWTVIVRLEPLDTGAGIGTVIGDYISAASTGADPVPLPVNIDLASGWSTLLSAIQAGGKYVALDLSACTMSGTTFDPGTANTGESRIVSLILPDAARSIKAGDYGNLVFKHFTVLASLTGATVTDIGDCAFWDCDFLTTVSLPAATAINYRAFYNCDALTTITLPAALSIDYSVFADCVALTSISLPVATTIRSFAFADCVALTTVSLPAATGIDDYAFRGCAALTTVSLPAATGIGGEAFQGCAALTTVSLPAATTIGASAFADTGTGNLSVTLNAAPPRLGTNMFANVSGSRTVTVKRPSAADSVYGSGISGVSSADAWADGFRGRGWNGMNVGSGTANTDISVAFADSDS